MSTFTRIYFADRGPHLADHDGENASDGSGFVAPETIPLDPTDALLQLTRALAFLPQAPAAAEEFPHLREPEAAAYADAWAQDESSFQR